MIYIQNNYLPKEIFSKLQNYCFNSEFEIKQVGEKQFSVLKTPDYILPYLQAQGKGLVLTFIRSAYKGFDNELRIHADNKINGETTSLASVLYISNNDITPNGTRFFKHHHYGIELPRDCSNEEFDRLITEDSNNFDKWSGTDLVNAEPNKLLMYNSQLFHAKYPSEITEGKRIVLVAFYK